MRGIVLIYEIFNNSVYIIMVYITRTKTYVINSVQGKIHE